MVTLPIKFIPRIATVQSPVTCTVPTTVQASVTQASVAVHSQLDQSGGLQTQGQGENQDKEVTSPQPTVKTMKISYTGEMEMIERPVVKPKTIIQTIGKPSTSAQSDSSAKAAVAEGSKTSSEISKKLEDFIMTSLKESFKVSKIKCPFSVIL